MDKRKAPGEDFENLMREARKDPEVAAYLDSFTVVIVKGGPGTGKSVVALNLMADLMLKEYNAHYATGSKAFAETLRKIIGTRGLGSWNAKPDAAKLALGIPKSSLWAYDPNGLNQIGCVYTAQGFEFDYVH